MSNPIPEKWLCDVTWQRVVDNELDVTELTELIAVCDQQPELWKRCAVAFLEEQALCSELRQLGSQWRDAAPKATSTSAEFDGVQCDGAVAPLRSGTIGNGHTFIVGKEDITSCKSPKRAAGALQSSVLNSLALAATVLLAFAIGWQASRRLGAQSQRAGAIAPISSLADANSKSTSNKGLPSAANVSDRFSQANNADGDHQFVDLPVSTTSTADAIHRALQRPNQFVPLDRAVPKPLAELQQRGLVHIESTEGIMTVQLQDGKTAVVPVQQFDVQTIGNAY